MPVALSISINTGQIGNRFARAQRWLKQEVLKDTNQFVPAITGSLATRAIAESEKAPDEDIIYPGPYARYLYYGKVMVDPETGSSYAPKGGTKVVTNKDLVFTQSVHPQAQSYWFEASKAVNQQHWIDGVKKIAGET